jgi:hypothetical protein
MRFASIVAVTLCAVPALASEAPAPPTPASPPSCDSAEHRQMDFWLGEWRLTWQGGTGTNRITRDFKNCVIVENFSESPANKPPHLRGMSVSSYQPLNRMWRQTWVDDQNGYYHLSGGAKPDGTFVLQTVRMGREPKMTRMVFEKITRDSLTWRWQESEDGAEWTDRWVIQYRRVK